MSATTNAQLIETIKAHIARGDDAGRDHYTKAGAYLTQLRSAKGMTATLFRSVVEKKIGVGLRQAQRYMAWSADASKLEEDRAKDRTRKAAKSRDGIPSSAQSATPVKRGDSNVVSFPLSSKPMGDNLEGTRTQRTAAFKNMIGEAQRLASFVDDLSTLEDFAELANAAEQTAKAYSKLAAQLRRQANGKQNVQAS